MIYSWLLSIYFLNGGGRYEYDHEINYSHATDIWGANIFDGFEIFRFVITVDTSEITHYKSYLSESLNRVGLRVSAVPKKNRLSAELIRNKPELCQIKF